MWLVTNAIEEFARTIGATSIYLYRLNTPAEAARRLLLVYLARINELADRAEFYHLLGNSCTINIIRYANAAGRAGRLDIRHILNGLFDQYLYYLGRVDTTLPFEELRQRSKINAAALAADGAPRLFRTHSRVPARDASLNGSGRAASVGGPPPAISP